jgi:serine protease Do
MHHRILRTLLPCAACFLFGVPGVAQQSSSGSLRGTREPDESVEAVIKKVSPSVVQLQVTAYGPTEGNDPGATGAVLGRQNVVGSGFVIDSTGYIMTNAHVVKFAQRVQVVVPSPETQNPIAAAISVNTHVLPARIIGVAPEADLALLKVDALNLPSLQLASYGDLRQGETVFAFGSPQGLRNSVTHGIVSAVARQTDPDSFMLYIQTDAPINPGNSGGPLVNSKGEVVGLNTFILSQSGGNEGLGFAIPSVMVELVYQQLRKYGHLHKSEMGIIIQTLTPTMAAALGLQRDCCVIVGDVLPGGPAVAAGLNAGDILLSVNGQSADNLPRVAFIFLTLEDGQTVHLSVLRGKAQLEINVPVVFPKHQIDDVSSLADPEKNLVPELGVVGLEIDNNVASMLPGLRDPFGIIVAARSAQATIEAPLAPGDIIRTLNGQRMTTLNRLRTALKALPAGAPVVLQIQRGGQLMFVAAASPP